ncbi:MAG: hypothetical protein WD988_01590 [Candidatus Curtissbacteria bacterium]
MNLSRISVATAAVMTSGLIFSTSVLAANPASVDGMTKGLETGKLQACQARENAIKNRSTHLVSLVSNMETKFDSIATRVETYYTSKVVPSGKTVANYDALLTDIQTKKTVVQTALTKTQGDAGSFSCDSDTPKAQLTQFGQDMQVIKTALKAYRTSIKNLIVAVRSVVGEENKATPSTGTQ